MTSVGSHCGGTIEGDHARRGSAQFRHQEEEQQGCCADDGGQERNTQQLTMGEEGATMKSVGSHCRGTIEGNHARCDSAHFRSSATRRRNSRAAARTMEVRREKYERHDN